ncbi:MAG TPA: glutamate 5-kinase [Blastocatellia bacterium]|nr:glutamate 5-kinase [Blastocatellia bacterium]
MLMDLRTQTPRPIAAEARRVVIKLGTATLTRDDGGIALSRFYSFIESIAALHAGGRQVLVVSSGAIGLGSSRLGIDRSNPALPVKQALAAVGQGRLMALYTDAFDRLGLTCAQVLLTEEDFSDRRRYLNLSQTISTLLELGAIPVINENDTVSTAELEPTHADAHRRVNFGDNDKLSALIASKIEADLLIILTDVDGLFTGDPNGSEQPELLREVADITPELMAVAGGARVGRGGMRTKLEAAQIAARSGCATVIANGRTSGVIDDIAAGREVGTLFLPQAGLSGKRRWIAFAKTVTAAVVVNDGARDAILRRKASLLPAGVTGVRGDFARGDVVSSVEESGHEFARALTNYSSSETRAVSGLKTHEIPVAGIDTAYDTVATRDHIVVLEGSHDGR